MVQSSPLHLSVSLDSSRDSKLEEAVIQIAPGTVFNLQAHSKDSWSVAQVGTAPQSAESAACFGHQGFPLSPGQRRVWQMAMNILIHTQIPAVRGRLADFGLAGSGAKLRQAATAGPAASAVTAASAVKLLPASPRRLQPV